MSYNPSLYSPYGFTPPQPSFQMPQSSNGLAFVDSISDLDTLKMPPGSVSQPYFLKDEDKFVIVTFDNAGGSTKELFSFKKEVIEDPNGAVTRADLDAFKAEIMEAINGKHVVPTPTAEAADPDAGIAADQANGII